MESEKNRNLSLMEILFYEIDLKCLEEKKQKQEEAKNGSRKGRGNNLCLFKRSAAIVAAASISAQSRRRMMIQQLSLQPLLLQPQPLLFPQQHIRQMIQRIQEQLFPPFPNREFPQPLLQPQLLLHPCATSGITTTSAITSTIGSR